MRIIRKPDLEGSDRNIRNSVYATTRFLLAADGIGVTVTDIILAPDVPETYGHDDHTEIAYCIEGDARLTDLATGTEHIVAPGTMWVAQPGERFMFVAYRPTRLICVFTPALVGSETGFANGDF